MRPPHSSVYLLLLVLLVGILNACDLRKGPSEQLEEVSLQELADSLEGFWRSERGFFSSGSGEGMRMRFGDSLEGTRNAYSYEGNERSMTSGHLAPIRLDRIDGRPAILHRGRDTAFVLAIDEERLVLGRGDRKSSYMRHEDLEI